MRRATGLCAALGPMLPLLGCPDGGGGDAPAEGTSVCAEGAAEASAVRFVAAFAGAGFAQPVYLAQHPDDDDRFYVLELDGRVVTLLASDPAGSRAEALDLADHVTLFTMSEGGLLAMAFAPDFAASGEIFLLYTEGVAGDFDSVVGRFRSPDDGLSFAPAAADPTVLAVAQPAGNHNGGDLHFGRDGLLYVSLGDGGGAGDPFENGQDTSTRLGAVLRLDVSTTPPGIPPDNPFVGSAADDALWAFGLRNPWRMSFDRATGDLWLADVGQGAQEEVDRIVRGGNYGWDCREGFAPFELDDDCAPGPIAPALAHAQPGFQSITGGFVYRGTALPALAGAYVYGDFVTGAVCAFFPGSSPKRVVSLDPPAGLSVVSFAEDREGELYLLDFAGSPSIYRIEAR